MKNNINFNLVKLLDSEIENRNLSSIRGGEVYGDCSCGCHHANNGGSSTCDNSRENLRNGLTSIGGGASCSANTLTEQQFFIGCE